MSEMYREHHFEYSPLSILPPILEAVADDNIDKLPNFIAWGVDLNAVDENGLTALHHAARLGKTRLLRELLLAGADRTKTTKKGQLLTILDFALQANHKECISLLLSEKFVVGKKTAAEKRDFLQKVANTPSSAEKISPLNLACHYSSSSDVVFELLKAGAHVNGSPAEKENFGLLPIHAACRYSSEEVVELLLQWRADPDVLSPKERLSPLSNASVLNKLGAFKALMKFGANLNAYCDIGFYPLLLVGRNLVDKNRSLIFKSFDLKEPAVREVFEMMRLILEYPEVDVDRQDLAGLTALHFACQANCREAVELLLNAGANSMIRSEGGDIAADNSSDPYIRQLLKDTKNEDTPADKSSHPYIRPYLTDSKNGDTPADNSSDPYIRQLLKDNKNGVTAAVTSSDHGIIHLLEGYKSEHPVTVIGYRNDMGSTQGNFKAVCFTRRTQCLVSSEGAYIEAGSVGSHRAERGVTDQQDVSERQEPEISLAIPKNALSQPVGLTLNYTPNPPVLLMPAMQRSKDIRYHSSKSEKETKGMLSKAVLPHKSNTQLIEQFEKSECQLAALTSPVKDTSEGAKETIISPYVTVTATEPVSLSEDAHLKIPHCAESTSAISTSKEAETQFRIIVKMQSLGSDDNLSEWTTIPESKVICSDKEVNIHISKFERASTFVAIASSTSEKPLREVVKKKLWFWIVGNPMLKRKMYVAAVCCTNAYKPGKLVAQVKEELFSPTPLQPWYPSHEPVSAEGDIKVVMSALEEEWSFLRSTRVIKQADLSSPDAIQSCLFCLCCKGDKLQSACCQCSFQYDETETEVDFFTPEPVGAKEEISPENATMATKSRKKAEQSRGSVSEQACAAAEDAGNKSALGSTSAAFGSLSTNATAKRTFGREEKGNRQNAVEAEERCQTAVPKKAEEAEQKANSSNGFESLSGIPTTQQLTKLAKRLVADDMWKYIARHLGFEETTIDGISKKYKENSREQAYQMLLKWKEAQSRSASIRNLRKALVEEDLTKTAADVFEISDELLKSL